MIQKLTQHVDSCNCKWDERGKRRDKPNKICTKSYDSLHITAVPRCRSNLAASNYWFYIVPMNLNCLGGARAVENLRLIMGELQVADVRSQVMLSLMTDFENFTVFKPHRRRLIL